ncbi:MAG: A/G-specific adenine glycosylase [Patescibacteria group bacterium]
MSTKRPSIKKFQTAILSWYQKNGRHGLPWRATRDPYRILVSEIMLQQTQVDRVIEKYTEFLGAFPTIKKLANAPVHDLLRIWKGLGYNRRALNVQKCVQKILSEYKGCFPSSVEDIEQLPGVGPYTARAVATFAFNQPHALIETNIRRIFIHFFFLDREGVSDAEIMPFVQKALWKKDPHAWYSALMDYGALAMKDVPNPNKKSRHYSKQSRFEGSRRYARAKILDYILLHAKASSSDLILLCRSNNYLKSFESTILDILNTLVSEGFIIQKGRYWRIKK